MDERTRDRIKCTAVVLAGGSGRRMGGSVAKQYLPLGEKPVIWYSLAACEHSRIIDRVILVVERGTAAYARSQIVEKYGFRRVEAVIEGGAERYLSVWEALRLIAQGREEKSGGEEYVFIHDGARPFLTEKLLEDTYRAARRYGACAAGVPVKDTVKEITADGFVSRTLRRRSLWAVQTPQVFEAGLICRAYAGMMEELAAGGCDLEITDDAMVAETWGERPVKLVEASYENIKITTPEDMKTARGLLG